MTYTPAWAGAVVAGLVVAGIRDVVIAPGSRSTPFALAALRHPALRCHSILDERSAAFFALGQGKVTGHPSVVLCTSGSAPAHFHPAVLEASATACPLVLLTADRPFSMHDCGAPQTTNQQGLFGTSVRDFVDLGDPNPSHDALRAAARRVERAVLRSLDPVPGPVQINARACKPLEPPPNGSPEADAMAALVAQLTCAVPVADHKLTARVIDLDDPVRYDLRTAERGLIVCGALGPHQAPRWETLAALAAATGFPIVAETASQLRRASSDPEVTLCDGFEALLRVSTLADRLRSDCVLQIGAAPLGSSWESYLSGTRRHVIHPRQWADPWQSATSVHISDPDLTLRSWLAALPPVAPSTLARRRHHRTELSQWNECAWKAVMNSVSDAGPLSEARAVEVALRTLPRGTLLALGSSLPVREVDLYARAPGHERVVWTQRGTNGIDGLVSGAAGAASVHGPTQLLLGDVSFLHDVGGLWIARRATVPLVLVVLNNHGGRIFEQLPVRAATTPEELEYFTTPHDLDLAGAAQLYGVSHLRAATANELRHALQVAYERSRCTIVEAVVAPESARDTLERIARELAREVARLGEPGG